MDILQEFSCDPKGDIRGSKGVLETFERFRRRYRGLRVTESFQRGNSEFQRNSSEFQKVYREF